MDQKEAQMNEAWVPPIQARGAFFLAGACGPDASQEKPSSRLDRAERYSFSQSR
jgi:hypothetical protein